jgi:hypothetical protein
MTDDVELKDELRLAIEGRKELGDEMEPAVIDAFVSRIEQRLATRAVESERALQRRREHQKEMVLGSMAISIPLLAIAAAFTGLPGVIAIWRGSCRDRSRDEPSLNDPARPLFRGPDLPIDGPRSKQPRSGCFDGPGGGHRIWQRAAESCLLAYVRVDRLLDPRRHLLAAGAERHADGREGVSRGLSTDSRVCGPEADKVDARRGWPMYEGSRRTRTGRRPAGLGSP